MTESSQNFTAHPSEVSRLPLQYPSTSGVLGGWFAGLVGGTIWVPCVVIPQAATHPWFAFGNLAIQMFVMGRLMRPKKRVEQI